MNVGILANPHKSGALQTLRALIHALQARGCRAVLDHHAAEIAGLPGGIAASDFSDHVDVAAVLGGDGTMLHAVSRLGHFEKPVAGINIGTLGFLTTCKETELELFVEALVTRSYTTSVRTLLDATVFRSGQAAEKFTALNEVTLARGETGRLVSLTAKVNGELLNHYRADGLIIATPTGSTAYSLSAGGPLISPSAGVFVITPICPHSLSQRSLIMDDSVLMEISPDGSSDGPMIFTVDGRDTTRIEVGDRIEVKKADRSFQLLRLQDRSFYEALRQKLRWHGV